MNVAVVGSRSLVKMEEEIIHILPDFVEESDRLISGGAKGVDSAVQEFARRKGRTIIIHYPNWRKFGKKAGFIRNVAIVADADKLVAFWDGMSAGTKHSIFVAQQKKIPIVVLMVDEEGNFNQIDVT